MGKKRGCLTGLISGCFLMLAVTAALCFFVWQWFQYQRAEAERNGISLPTQLVRAVQTFGDPPPAIPPAAETEENK